MSAEPTDLTTAVIEVADCPCEEHQQALLLALERWPTLALAIIGTPSPGLQPAVQVVRSDGLECLLAYPHPDLHRRAHPGGHGGVVPTGQVLRMVVTQRLGGLLIGAATERQHYAVLPRRTVKSLLKRLDGRR